MEELSVGQLAPEWVNGKFRLLLKPDFSGNFLKTYAAFPTQLKLHIKVYRLLRTNSPPPQTAIVKCTFAKRIKLQCNRKRSMLTTVRLGLSSTRFDHVATINQMSRVIKNQPSAYAKTKTQVSFAVTATLISAFVFATWIVQYLDLLNTKFKTLGISSSCTAWFVSDLVRIHIVGFLVSRLKW